MTYNKIKIDAGIYKVSVDSALKKINAGPWSFKERYDHIDWCRMNCKSIWYNECEDYSYMCFHCSNEALEFAKLWSSLNEKELVWYTLVLS